MAGRDIATKWFQHLYSSLNQLDGFVLYGSVRTEKHIKISALLDKGFTSDPPPDSYYRVCPVSHIPESGRGSAAMSIALPALWFDFDVAKNDRYCPKRVDALWWMAEQPVIGKYFQSHAESGEHGLHVYAVGSEPYLITTREELRIVQSALLNVRNYLFEHCPWKLDSVFDLSRILRIPGSYRKDIGRELKVMQLGDRVDIRQAVSDMSTAMTKPALFGQAGVETPQEQPASGSVPAPWESRGPLVEPGKTMSWPPPEPPAMKLMAALDNDPGLAASWNRKSDIEDKTISGYGFSLLNRMALLEWTDEEMISTLYHWRKDQPYSREKSESWYRDEVRRVREKTQRTVDERSRQSRAEKIVTSPESELDPLSTVRAGLGWPGLERIEVDVLTAEDGYSHQERVWKFIGKTGADMPAIIQVPTSTLLSKREMQVRIFDGIGALIPAATLKKGWEPLLAAINMAAIEATSDEDANTASELREMIVSWLLRARKTDRIEVLLTDASKIVLQTEPNGPIRWHWSALKYMLRINGFESMRNDKLASLLRSYCKCTVERVDRLPLWNMPMPSSSSGSSDV